MGAKIALLAVRLPRSRESAGRVPARSRRQGPPEGNSWGDFAGGAKQELCRTYFSRLLGLDLGRVSSISHRTMKPRSGSASRASSSRFKRVKWCERRSFTSSPAGQSIPLVIVLFFQ